MLLKRPSETRTKESTSMQCFGVKPIRVIEVNGGENLRCIIDHPDGLSDGFE